jgi:hypothetical protein
VFGKGAKVVKTDDRIAFLIDSEGNITICHTDTELAIDFSGLDLAELFLSQIQSE